MFKNIRTFIFMKHSSKTKHKSSKNKYIRTDLASENIISENGNTDSSSAPIDSGYSYTEKKIGTVTRSMLEIKDKNGADKFGKPIGRYITLSFKKIWLLTEEEQNDLCSVIASELASLCEHQVPDCKNILIAGLGNRSITADAIGPQSIDNIIVTRHLSEHDISLFNLVSSGSGMSISAVAPGVIGQTGIETAELIAGIVKTVQPQIIICIDALAARSVDRLASTIQLSDTGISPGSGVKNNRQPVNKDLLGIPVIAIGVPTVVDSSTLVYDALDKAGISELSNELISVLENGMSFFVSLKETDLAAKEVSDILSRAINLAFTFRNLA